MNDFTYKSKLTFGGLPEESALEWNSDTYLKLGSIVRDLMSGKSDLRQKGVIAFFELKRLFMRETFEEYLCKLDSYRKNLGFTPVTEMVNLVSSVEMVTLKPLSIPAENAAIPERAILDKSVSSFREALSQPEGEVIQLSLF